VSDTTLMRRSPPKEDPFLEWLAWLMDESISIGPWKIGLDGLVGLIPGIGDMTGAAVSSFIILRAAQNGIARSAVIRMVINVAMDSVLGGLPLFGDIFDLAYKSNIRNLQIYREAVRGERRPIKDFAFILFVAAVLLLIVTIPLLGFIYLVKFLTT
jgi:Domain of unknown function (DUF4112)